MEKIQIILSSKSSMEILNKSDPSQAKTQDSFFNQPRENQSEHQKRTPLQKGRVQFQSRQSQ